MLSTLLTFTGCITLDPPNNPLAIDDDGDGYTEFEGDCDDRDPNTFPGSAAEATSNECMKDDDRDGFGDVNVTGYFDAGTDCDDSNPFRFPGAAENESEIECLTDEDEDGWSAEVGDCDDGDSSMPNDDMDCDGVLSVDDCDDSDPNTVDDMDCDGVLSVDDCDDNDPSTVNDMDCDGHQSLVISGVGLSSSCVNLEMVDSFGDGWNGNAVKVYEDGVLTGTYANDSSYAAGTVHVEQHCFNATTSTVDFMFIDGNYNNEVFLTIVDSTTGSVLGTGNGDGASGFIWDGVSYTNGEIFFSLASTLLVSGSDCDDSDPFSTTVFEDGDCDGVLSADDCDDNDSSLLEQSNDGDCDGVLSADDCDDGDSSMPNDDMDCDGVLSVDDCDDSDPNTVDDMDCDGVLSADDCDDFNPFAAYTTNDGDCDGVLTAADCDDNDAINMDICLDLGGGQSIDLARIPSGSDSQGRYIITKDFYLMTIEVTQGMFAEIMNYEAYNGESTSNSNGSFGIGNDYPAYYVSWHMAADFANRVTQRHNSVNGTNLQECYSCSSSGNTSVTCIEAVNPYQCSGYVLPTEAEWEYAARSGTQYDFWTPDGGGNYSASACNGTETIQDGVSNPLLRDYAWYCGNNDNQHGAYGSKEVGQKLPNGFGLYDMYGNLWEWTADWSGCSFPQASTDPYCGSASSNRIRRGGSWSNYPSGVWASYRNHYYPAGRSDNIGFRLGLHHNSY